jgi:hypothetical protein
MIKYACFFLPFLLLTHAAADETALRDDRLANVDTSMRLMAGDVSPEMLRL